MSNRSNPEVRKRLESAAKHEQFQREMLAKRSITREPIILTDIWANIPTFDGLTPVNTSLSSFNHTIKSKDKGKIRELLANHKYGRFTVARHLRMIWHYATPEAGRYGQNRAGLSEAEITKRKLWYAIVASGGSLHKLETAAFFTKKETHRFLNAPREATFEEAIIYAYAGGYTDDISVIMRCYKSKLIQENFITSEFWRSVLRFFCVNPIVINKMNDLIDYISYERRQNREWSIAGRTLSSLTVEMIQWHRTLARAKRLGNETWEGIPVADQIVEFPHHGKKTIWTLEQIKTSVKLAEEGSKMHHCVYSYQYQCISGRTSIWTMKKYPEGQAHNAERALTIEVDNHTGTMVQIRGYANRAARDFEVEPLRKLASEAGFRINEGTLYDPDYAFIRRRHARG